MQAVGNITSDTFTITVQDNDGTAISGVGWEVPSNYYKEFSEDGSARYIYISLTIPKTFGGGSNAPTVTVVYQNVSGTGAFKDLNNQFMLNGTSASGKLNVQYGDLSSTQELIVTVLGSIVSFFIILGITVPLILGLKGGSTEGMIFTALTMQAIYFSSLINFVFPPMFSGFMQYLRISTLELDSAPNVFIEYLIDEGSRSKYLIRTDDMNYYKIANLIEFSSLKLLILFTFNIIFVALLLSLICLKKKRSKILAILENMKYKGFLLMFAIMFVPLEFSCFGERQNMEKTSPYKIVSGTSAFLFIFISYLGIFTLSKLILTNSIQTDRKVQERFNVLQMGSKKTKKVLVMFYPIILMKMILIVTATVHLSNTVGAFGIIAFLIQLLSIGFFIYYRPFKELKSKSKLKFLLNSNALAITTEVTLSLYYFLFTLYSNTSPSLTETICLLQLSLISLLSISTCTIGIYCSYKNLILYTPKNPIPRTSTLN